MIGDEILVYMVSLTTDLAREISKANGVWAGVLFTEIYHRHIRGPLCFVRCPHPLNSNGYEYN